MDIRSRTVGTVDGHDVAEYTVDTGTGFAVTVWTYGASLLGVTAPDRDGRLVNVVRRLPDLAAHTRVPYVGSTMGRYCRCVSGARFSLDGKEYELDRNDGQHHLHGGTVGFDRHVWQAEADSDSLSVRLRLESPDGDQGYPGTVAVETVYRAHPSGRLTIEFSATTSASTLIGLTNHAFWNLTGSGTVDRHRLAINADRFIPFDDNLIPLPGPPAPVEGGALDHRTAKEIGVLDNFFVLDDPAWAAELTDPGSGRVLRMRTDQRGIGVYSGDGFVVPRAGICLQTGAWPDAPNRPDYPPVRLDPGQTYRASTTYEFATSRAAL